MIRIVWSSDDKIIEQYTKKMINNFGTTDVVRVDGDIEEVTSIKQHFISGSIFDETSKRVVVYKNASFLTSPSKLKKSEKDQLDKIAEVIMPDDELLVIFSINTDKLSSEKWLKTWLDKVAVTHGKVPEKRELEAFVQKYFTKKNSSITTPAVKRLIDKCDSSFSIVVNESKKLTALNEPITEEIVEELVNDYKKKNLFKLPLLIVNENSNEAKKELEDLIIDGNDINQIVAVLISQLGFYKKLSFYMTEFGNDYDSIRSAIGGNPYRVKIGISDIRGVNIDKLTHLINDSVSYLVEIRRGKKINLIDYLIK